MRAAPRHRPRPRGRAASASRRCARARWTRWSMRAATRSTGQTEQGAGFCVGFRVSRLRLSHAAAVAYGVSPAAGRGGPPRARAYDACAPAARGGVGAADVHACGRPMTRPGWFSLCLFPSVCSVASLSNANPALSLRSPCRARVASAYPEGCTCRSALPYFIERKEHWGGEELLAVCVEHACQRRAVVQHLQNLLSFVCAETDGNAHALNKPWPGGCVLV
jgi:hypothetical protein